MTLVRGGTGTRGVVLLFPTLYTKIEEYKDVFVYQWLSSMCTWLFDTFWSYTPPSSRYNSAALHYIFIYSTHIVWLSDGHRRIYRPYRKSTMLLLARNLSKWAGGFVLRWGLTSKLFVCINIYYMHHISYICYINMQCTIILESNSMFYHFSSDSTVCTACLPSLNIDRCKSTRFPVVGQNLIQNVRFLSTHHGRVVCFCGYLLPFYIELNSCVGRLRQLLTIHVMMNHDWHSYLTAMSH